jgi:hypothetical protein
VGFITNTLGERREEAGRINGRDRYRYETGKRTPPAETLKRFAILTGCSERTLLRLVPPSYKPRRLPRRWPPRPLARVLVALRVRKGVPARVVASTLGRKLLYWYSVEGGDFRPPLDVLRRFAAFVDCRPEILERAYNADLEARNKPLDRAPDDIGQHSAPASRTGGFRPEFEFWQLLADSLPVGHLSPEARERLRRSFAEAYLLVIENVETSVAGHSQSTVPGSDSAAPSSDHDAESPISELLTIRSSLLETKSSNSEGARAARSVTEALTALGWRDPNAKTLMCDFTEDELRRALKSLSNVLEAVDDDAQGSPADLEAGDIGRLIDGAALHRAVTRFRAEAEAVLMAGPVVRGPALTSLGDSARDPWYAGRRPTDFYYTWRCYCGYWDGSPVGHAGRNADDSLKPNCPHCGHKLRYARITYGEIQMANSKTNDDVPRQTA